MPGASAASLFPAAARANRSIFYDKQGNARSVAEIRANFAGKLDRGTQMAMNGAVAPAAASRGAGNVQPADYVRIETQRLSQSPSQNDLIRPKPETARLAYLMLATFGR
jgi:hypothetical protein